MTDERDEFGPWIEHDGEGCRVPRGVVCETEHADGTREVSPSTGRDWSGWTWYACVVCDKPGWKILRYRIRRPRALRELREMVETLPTREGAES